MKRPFPYLPKRCLQKLWQDWLAPLAFALLITQFGATAVRVDGASMLPTLRHGEMLVIPKAEGWAHQLGMGSYQRGDIVVFKPPRSAVYEWKTDYQGIALPWAYRPYLVKRVVAVAGDKVQVRGGQVQVNGQPVSEPRLTGYWDTYCHDTFSELANTPLITVPAGEYFVMGDNRSLGGSLDSRYFGPVNVHDIAGRAITSVWPLARKRMAVPACDTELNPEQRVKMEGPIGLNWRLLSPSQR